MHSIASQVAAIASQVPPTFSTMSSFHFELLLCLNGHPVPVVKQTLRTIDPYELAENLEHFNSEEMVEADLVSFKATAEHWWIHQALTLPNKWWVLHSSKIPLLLEIRELIKAKKASQGSSSRLPKQPDSLVLLKVRSKILVVQNSTSQMRRYQV